MKAIKGYELDYTFADVDLQIAVKCIVLSDNKQKVMLRAQWSYGKSSTLNYKVVDKICKHLDKLVTQAVCSEGDTFDLEVGLAIAAVRMNKHIAGIVRGGLTELSNKIQKACAEVENTDMLELNKELEWLTGQKYFKWNK